MLVGGRGAGRGPSTERAFVTIAIVLLVLIVGLLMFALSANDKVTKIGFVMFCCGLLVLLFDLGPAAVGAFLNRP